MKKKISIVMVIMLFITGFSGCSKGCSGTDKELSPLDFTVVTYDDIPKELMSMIDKEKAQDFKLTYQSEGWLYIARGYGLQNSGGYSISVKELSGADNAIYFDSELIGPGQDEVVNKLSTYPYIVVKTEDLGLNVVFR